MTSRADANKSWPWKNFKPEEVNCKCGCGLMPTVSLMDALQYYRDKSGLPVVLNSVSRCEKYNRKVGGAKNSYHVKGEAADIRITKDQTRQAIHFLATLCGFKGLGDYDSFVHVDIGPSRYWDERK